MNQTTPNSSQSQPDALQGASDAGEGTTVCIAKQADGTFLVYPENDAGGETAAGEGQEQAGGKTCKSIDEALNAARDMLTGDDGGMSVEQAFQGGFNGSGVPGDSGMGGGY